MAIWDKIRGEFIDIIEWLDDSADTMVHRFERHGNEIKYGAKLVVRESQAAVFVNEGKLADGTVFDSAFARNEPADFPLDLGAWQAAFGNEDGARYAAEAAKVPEADSLIRSINSKFVTRVELLMSEDKAGINPTKLPSSVQIVDAFNRPIRFVHPSMDGGFGDVYAPGLKRSGEFLEITSRAGNTLKPEPTKFRRSARPFDPKTASNVVGDADEGICTSERPYFYSAGLDGDPGTREAYLRTATRLVNDHGVGGASVERIAATLELTKGGEIVVDARGQTSQPGIFAAGDCTTVPYKQIIIAAGEGSKAALSAFDYLIRQ